MEVLGEDLEDLTGVIGDDDGALAGGQFGGEGGIMEEQASAEGCGGFDFEASDVAVVDGGGIFLAAAGVGGDELARGEGDLGASGEQIKRGGLGQRQHEDGGPEGEIQLAEREGRQEPEEYGKEDEDGQRDDQEQEAGEDAEKMPGTRREDEAGLAVVGLDEIGFGGRGHNSEIVTRSDRRVNRGGP